MDRLQPNDVVILFASLGTLLLTARIFADVARKLGQPTVLGEIPAGVLLGPTVLGRISPDLFAWLFPTEGGVAISLNAFLSIAIALFLLVAGMEVNLSSVWRQGRAAIAVGLAGVVIPFGMGVSAAILAPDALGREEGASHVVFALFLGIALSISALPVIAKTLMDLNLYRSDLGMLVIAAAVMNDLIGWLLFALVLGMAGGHNAHSFPVAYTIVFTLAFTVLVLTVGRWLIHRILPWVQAHTAWPGGVLGLSLGLGLFAAAFTEWIGVHALFGTFLVGVAIGDSSHLREQTRTTMHQFIAFIFAPLFFASIGLAVDFALHFDAVLCLIILVIACIGKVLGCWMGARIGRVIGREAWGVGFAMNARGAMEIILGLIAWQNGIIHERMFVALVIMAIVTSLISGPVLRKLLHLKNPRRLDGFLNSRAFIHPLKGLNRFEVIQEMSHAAAAVAGLDPVQVEAAVVRRERQGSTGIGQRVAVPHARLEGLKQPFVAVGISPNGVDFDAPDGEPSRLIFLLLTPRDDDGAQLEILADIARKFGDPVLRSKAINIGGYTEFLALLRTQTEEH